MIFADPLAAKELRGATRRWQTYALRGLYVALAGLVVARFTYGEMGRLSNPSAFSNLSRDLFRAFLLLQLSFATLAATWSAADLVLKETRRGTLGLLYLTPLTATDVAFGKWKAALAQALALVLCGAPVMAVCAYLGGVGPLDVAWSFALTLSIAGIAAAFSFHFSAAVRSHAGVVGLTLAALLGFSVAPLWFGVFAGWRTFAFIHPVFAVAVALDADSAGGVAADWAWAGATPVSFLFAYFLVRSSSGKLGKRSQDVPRPDELVVQSVPAWVRRISGRGAQAREVPERDPLLWKEIATRAALRMDVDVQRSVAWIFVIFLGLAWLATGGEGMGIVAFAGLVFTAAAVLTGATLFSSDKEGRRFDMLLSTPLRDVDIVRAKLLSGLLAPESLKAVALMFAVTVAWTLRLGFPGVFATAAVLFPYVLFAYVLAATASLHAPTAQSAFLATCGILGLQLTILPLALPELEALRPSILLTLDRRTWEAGHFDTPLAPFVLFATVHLGLTAALAVAMIPGLRRVTGRA